MQFGLRQRCCDTNGSTMSVKIACWMGDLPEEELGENIREGAMERSRILPTEVLFRVFEMLPPKDLKNVMLVCKSWHEAADTPTLWTWVTFVTPWILNVNDARTEQNIALFLEMVSLRRLQNVKHIHFYTDVSNNGLVDSQHRLLKAALEHPGLRKIRLYGDITLLDPHLVTEVLIKMDEVVISRVMMSTQQKTEFLSALQNTNHMKTLVWTPCSQEDDGFKDVNHTVLANAVKKVEKLHLNQKMTSAQQAVSIFNALQSDHSLVKSLSYKEAKFFDGGREVDPDLMSSVVRKLEEVDLTSFDLTLGQSSAVCAALSDESTLQKLTLRDNDLQFVDAQVLARMVRYVENLDLSRTRLGKEELEPMFVSIVTGQRLKKLSIAENSLFGGNLDSYQYTVDADSDSEDDRDQLADSEVDPEKLAEMATCVEELDLGHTNMSKAQTRTLIRELCDAPGKLTKLVLQGNDLTNVKGESISAMVTQIQDLDLSKTKLSPDQVDEIFEEITNGPGRLRILKMTNIDIRGVIPELLAEAVNNLERVFLSDMPLLTRFQVKRILSQALEEGTNLEELSIAGDFECRYHHHHPSDCDCRSCMLNPYGHCYHNTGSSVFDDKYGYENRYLFNELFQL